MSSKHSIVFSMIIENSSSRKRKKSLPHILISCYLRHKIPLVCMVDEKFFPGHLEIGFWSWSLMIYPSMSWKRFYVYVVKYPPHTALKSSKSTRSSPEHSNQGLGKDVDGSNYRCRDSRQGCLNRGIVLPH